MLSRSTLQPFTYHNNRLLVPGLPTFCLALASVFISAPINVSSTTSLQQHLFNNISSTTSLQQHLFKHDRIYVCPAFAKDCDDADLTFVI